MINFVKKGYHQHVHVSKIQKHYPGQKKKEEKQTKQKQKQMINRH